MRMALLEINLAITQLIGVTPRSAEEERSLLNAIYKEMASAAERCQSELLALPDGATMLLDLLNWHPVLRRRMDREKKAPRLPAWFVYPDLVVRAVQNLPAPLPEPIKRLSEVAHRSDRYLSAYILSHRKAFAFLLEEARAGRLHFYARRYEHAGLDILEPRELELELTVEDCGGRMRQKYPGTREFYDGHIDGGDFLRILRDGPLTTSQIREIMLEKAETWFQAQAPEYHRSPDQTQAILLRGAFPDLKGHRQLIRDFKGKRNGKNPKS